MAASSKSAAASASPPPPAAAALPVLPAPPKGPAGGPEPRPHYLLQLGAFRDQGNATRLQAALEAKGYVAAIVPQATRIGTLDLVQIGGFADWSAAQDAALSLERGTGLVPIVLKATTP